jgi:hypothetical protein
VVPEEERLGSQLGAGIEASGLGGGGRNGRPRYHLGRGEHLLHQISPACTLTMEVGGQQAGPGPATLLVTNRALALAMRRSYVRLPYARLTVEPWRSGSRQEIRLRAGRARYRLAYPGCQLGPFAGALGQFVAGKQALGVEPPAGS